ncbi:DNA (cytosine-5)-methyltransferase 3 isoform X3 [Selaginella moellendorffii]|uniref:DNA (cytosine-5)-methyltransferase 3 isoform X3 n=1 Tax=Selaginella moellendorffii TaxID=88036 RepID=UPI000D1C9753|nr:DNA (cytosine-5)-methyltransferase 3 isoform X3 [Selaginella moellendorffii]|eukprot:XP_024520318.1 DNA (cytosine-5)-methyltransferase 3 isoform X3 [Selaginella moellendorffii]
MTAAASVIRSDNDDFVDAIVLSSSDDDDDASGKVFSPPAEQRSVATRVKSRKRKLATPAVTASAATVSPERSQQPSKPRKLKRISLEDVNRRAMKDIQNELRDPSPEGMGSREETPASMAKVGTGSARSRKKSGPRRASATSSGTVKEEDVAAKEDPCPQRPSGDCIVVLDSSEEDQLSPSAVVREEDIGKKVDKKAGKSVQRKDPGPNPKPKPKPRKSFGPKKQPLPPPPSPDDDDFAQEPILVESDDDDEEDSPSAALVACPRKGHKLAVKAHFVGKPIPAARAKRQWPNRYDKSAGAGSQKCVEHYEEAVVDGKHYKVGDCVALEGDDAEYLGKVLEFFKTANQENWFRVQWFFRFSDTAIGDLDDVHLDNKRVFLSDDEDDNMIECIIKKVKVSYAPVMDAFSKKKIKQSCDYYFDMGYTGDFSTFYKVPSDASSSFQTAVTRCSDTIKPELILLDLYCGCGAMSTGLSMGAALGGVNLVTKWAVDYNEHACNSMKYNHPETEVRNEDAECFLLLLKEWQKLCTKYEGHVADDNSNASSPDSNTLGADEYAADEYEVQQVVDIRMAGIQKPKKPDTSSKMPEKPIKRRLEFKVRWKGYTSDHDTWEPVDHLDSCQERIRDFVLEGRRRRILPLPGDVDMVCGGPPCQGASGYNRFRNTEAPLTCPRNRQMVIFMDIVGFLRPKFVLMENVVDILKFQQGLLGRYAMFRLVDMRYQAKLGMMAAGSYGLPQFRMRVFLWGAAPSEMLPAFPLPSHDAIYKGNVPNQFSRNVVKHIGERQLEKALFLGDSISDLPPVKNCETRDEIPYRDGPKTEFQTRIRSARDGEALFSETCNKRLLLRDFTVFYGRGPRAMNSTVHDHRPLRLNDDDYQRACRIPKRKGANFRDLGGLKIKDDNSVTLDLTVEREYLPSGKPLIPDYAISFIKGRSLKPFARMWWDETVPTVITRAEPHNHRMLHPTQDRVLTVRENARLQGFPDWYKLTGSVKERYIQVGNAVAMPVARALGYSLALTTQRLCKEPRLELPAGFPCFESQE